MMKFDSQAADVDQINAGTLEIAHCLAPAVDQLLDLARGQYGAMAPLIVMRGGIAAALQPLLYLIFQSDEDRTGMLSTLRATVDAAFHSAMEMRAEQPCPQPEGDTIQ